MTIPTLFKFKERGATPGIMKRELRKLQKLAYEQDGLWWHKMFRPKHFTKRGATEYGYAPRQGEAGSGWSKGFRRSYTGKKLRRYGHTRPLVLTGETQSMTRVRDVRANSNGVRVVLRGANKLNWRYAGSEINMREEMTRVSEREQVEIVRLHDRVLDRKLNEIKATRTA